MTPRAQNPRAAWPSNDDNGVFSLAVILAGGAIGSYLLWTNYHAEISAAVMAWRHQEIVLLHHLTNRFDLADRQMRASDPAGVTLSDLYGISHAIGMAWRLPGALLIALLAAACLLRNAPSRFRRQFDLQGLIREQVPAFPAVAGFARRQLRLVSPTPDAPRPADYALTTEEWLKHHALAEDGTLDRSRAQDALRAQLGPRWTGLAGANPHVRALFAAFALHLAERREDAIAVLGACAAALADGEVKEAAGPAKPLALPDSLIAKVDVTLADRDQLANPAIDIADRHAWTHTALMSLLNAARLRAGVLPPAQFAWLRLVDRPLWYALHSLGFESEGIGRYLHPSPRVEAVGARDHWAVERLARRPVEAPRFERALEALTRAHAGDRH